MQVASFANKKDSLNLSKHVILRQEIGLVPIHDLHLGLLRGKDVELVEYHHLLVVQGLLHLVYLLALEIGGGGLGFVNLCLWA